MTAVPSSDDLAALRSALNGAGWRPVDMHPADGGAWQHELQRGIGYGDGRTGRGYIASGYIDARREASALRSRAYARSVEPVQMYAMRAHATVEERWYGIPWSWSPLAQPMTFPELPE